MDLTQDVAFWFFALFVPAVVLVCGVTLLVEAGGQRVVGVILVVLGLAGCATTAAYLRRPVLTPGDDG